jgi:hypothetical protein
LGYSKNYSLKGRQIGQKTKQGLKNFYGIVTISIVFGATYQPLG